jgi:hypothetical protein
VSDTSGLTVTIDADKARVSFKPYEWIDGQAERFSDQHLPGFPSERDEYVTAASILKGFLQGVGLQDRIDLTVPLPPAPASGNSGGTAALSPADILQDLVDGINAAESRLNVQNFVIASGSVQATLNLPATSVTLNFNITPKPYN